LPDAPRIEDTDLSAEAKTAVGARETAAFSPLGFMTNVFFSPPARALFRYFK
jgi:hypothetical protein